jgi:hypothetical protein
MTAKVKNANGPTKRSIRAMVVNEMIEAHVEEFHDRMAAKYEEFGFTYQRPITPEERKAAKERAAFEKAKAEFEALIAEYPGLADRARPAVAVDFGDDDDDVDAAPVDLGIDPALARA